MQFIGNKKCPENYNLNRNSKDYKYLFKFVLELYKEGMEDTRIYIENFPVHKVDSYTKEQEKNLWEKRVGPCMKEFFNKSWRMYEK